MNIIGVAYRGSKPLRVGNTTRYRQESPADPIRSATPAELIDPATR
jgi:hypothetical protein